MIEKETRIPRVTQTGDSLAPEPGEPAPTDAGATAADQAPSPEVVPPSLELGDAGIRSIAEHESQQALVPAPVEPQSDVGIATTGPEPLAVVETEMIVASEDVTENVSTIDRDEAAEGPAPSEASAASERDPAEEPAWPLSITPHVDFHPEVSLEGQSSALDETLSSAPLSSDPENSEVFVGSASLEAIEPARDEPSSEIAPLLPPIEAGAPIIEAASEAEPAEIVVPRLPEPALILPEAVESPLQEPAPHLPPDSSPNAMMTLPGVVAATAGTGSALPALADWRETARLALRYAALAFGAYMALVVFLVVAYRFIDPPASNLMIYQALMGREVNRQWVDIGEVSPHLVRAVLVAEDGAFCSHWGIDFAAMEQAIENAVDGVPRGASTISMQVTKNLFLWQSKSYVRKAIELPLTFLMELIWPKWRILEVYLNVAEWAPGIFGAEAAAHHHFDKRAKSLSEREAALLAASLPNPMVRDAGDPGPRTARKAAVIQNRMHSEGPDAARCIFSDK